MASNPVTKVTEEQYLALDREAEVRSEFLDGEMWAMSGGSTRHSALATNIVIELGPLLRGTDCRVFMSDLRVRVSPGRMYVYPDVTVVCGKLLFADDRQDILLNPAVIFEGLSPSTENYDRGVKLQQYLSMETLKDYILIDQNKVRVEQYARDNADTWTFRAYQHLDDELKIDSVGVSCQLSGIYDRVELPGV